MTDLHDALRRRADRGRPRGADAVLAAARARPAMRLAPEQPSVDWPRRVAAALAVAVVAVLVAVAVAITRRDDPAEQAPIDEGQVDTAPGAEVIEGPLFGAETGTTLLVSAYTGSLVALDLDTGIARRMADFEGGILGGIGGRVVSLTQGGRLQSLPFDLAGDPVDLPGLVNGRPLGSDSVRIYPAGASNRFWISSGPLGDHPNRPWLAEERTADGAIPTPVLTFTRQTFVGGATTDMIVVQTDLGGGRAEIRDPSSGEVVRVLDGPVLATSGELVAWQSTCDECELHVLDTATGAEQTVETGSFASFAAFSPDGSHLAIIGSGGEGNPMTIVDIAAGTATAVPGRETLSGYAPPVWSADGQWVFGAAGRLDDAGGGLTAYHLGAQRARTVSVAGLVPSSILAVDRADGPPLPIVSEPCPPVDDAGRPGSGDENVVILDDEGNVAGEEQMNFTSDAPCVSTVVLGLHDPLASGATGDADAIPVPPATTVPAADVDPADVPLADIPVIVANGTGGIEGVAGAVTELLVGLGYLPGPPTDTLPSGGETILDTVYYIERPVDYEWAALMVAADLGLPPEAVLPMPDPPPADVGLAAVLVVVGSAPGGLADSVTTTTSIPSG